MLEIVRGRPWKVAHTIYDTEDGPLSDLSGIDSLTCEIRERHGSKNHKGYFEHPLIAEVTVTKVDLDSQIILSLTEEATSDLFEGTYQIDLVATLSDGSTESYLDPEPIRVVNRPTQL